MTKEEKLSEGQTIIRDSDGRFVSSKLTSERAKELSKIRWGSESKERTNALLQDRGIDPEGVDEGLRSLAEIATSGRAGAVSAAKYLDKLTGFFRDEPAIDVVDFKITKQGSIIYNKREYIPLPTMMDDRLKELERLLISWNELDETGLLGAIHDEK